MYVHHQVYCCCFFFVITEGVTPALNKGVVGVAPGRFINRGD